MNRTTESMQDNMDSAQRHLWLQCFFSLKQTKNKYFKMQSFDLIFFYELLLLGTTIGRPENANNWKSINKPPCMRNWGLFIKNIN